MRNKQKNRFYIPQNIDSDKIVNSGAFELPLYYIGRNPSQNENKFIAKALNEFANRKKFDDFEALETYLHKKPKSPYRCSLLFNLGKEYFVCGKFSKAMSAYSLSWELGKKIKDENIRKITETAVTELIVMHARLGNAKELNNLLNEVKDINFIGSNNVAISGAKTAYWMMINQPEISFRCGPLSLNSILLFKNSPKRNNDLIKLSESTKNGFSLSQIHELSELIGMELQMARRLKGNDLPLPAIVHWKLNHFAAITQEVDERYEVIDPTFGTNFITQISKETLAEEASGFFLIPAKMLPNGWQKITEKDAKSIWGKGTTRDNDTDRHTEDDHKKDQSDDCDESFGLAKCNVHLMLVNLNIQDTPIKYNPPRGIPIEFVVTYNYKEANQPPIFQYSNLGPKWTFSWLSYITEIGNSNNVVRHYALGGGTNTFEFDSQTQSFKIENFSQAILRKTSQTNYEMTMPNGQKRIFDLFFNSIGNQKKYFLTKIIDSTGINVTNINYYKFSTVAIRISSITDALGDEMNIHYELANAPLVITKVVDPYGRTAVFSYNNDGLLEKITDVMGLESLFNYEPGTDFINEMITPYGSTQFQYGENGRTRWLEIITPDQEKERVEFNENPATFPYVEPSNLIPDGMFTRPWVMYARNTFFWNKKAMKEFPGDYTKAQVYHFTHTKNFIDAAGVLESMKNPFENRVWYNYPGQTTNHEATMPGRVNRPSKIGRVLDDGSTKLQIIERDNLYGFLTKSIDPLGRELRYTYDPNNQRNLKKIERKINGGYVTLSTIEYDNVVSNMPSEMVVDHSSIDSIVFKRYWYTYNQFGQIETFKIWHGPPFTAADPIVFIYDNDGYLKEIHLNSSVHLKPDGTWTYETPIIYINYDNLNGKQINRIKSWTNSYGNTTSFEYDNFDRITKITYPDNTTEEITYYLLDPVRFKDRGGRITTMEFNSIRQPILVVDPLGIPLRYEWCKCGGLSKITDGRGYSTLFNYDIQGRLISKIFSDGTIESYNYEQTTSRLISISDPKNQEKQLDYFQDNKLKSVNLIDATGNLIPEVSFEYDDYIGKMTKMIDSFGGLDFIYNNFDTEGATSKIKRISHQDYYIDFQYEPSGSLRWTTINGSILQYTWMRDVSRGINWRINNARFERNNLGRIRYRYDKFWNLPEELKVELENNVIHNKTTFDWNPVTHNLESKTTTPSNFYSEYKYNEIGEIIDWEHTRLNHNKKLLSYDVVGQLTEVKETNIANPLPSDFQNQKFQYDYAGNLIKEESSGPLGNSATHYHYNNVNQLIGIKRQNNHLISFSYDANGNMIEDEDFLYEWDVLNRLTGINYKNQRNQRTEIKYDGFGRFVEIQEINGNQVKTKNLIWNRHEIVISIGDYIQYYFPQGVKINSNQKFFFEWDHLGSLSALLDESGGIVNEFDYDAWGVRRESNPNFSFQIPFGYTGHYLHLETGLYFTLYRVYNPKIRRWLSRDPIGERGGLNLYTYARNNPIVYVDLLGLDVVIHFNRKTGELNIADDKGNIVTGPAESGGKPFGDPIPPGEYDILEHPDPDYFRLEPLDEKYGDDTHASSGRDLFRLHRPGRTIGCISAKDKDFWEKVKKIMQENEGSGGTKRVDSKSWNRHFGGKKNEFLGRYGTLIVE